MKLNHEKTIRNGRTRTTATRYINSKKLRMMAPGVHSRLLLSAQQIAELALVSVSHAYKIIADPDKYLTLQTRRLLEIQALGQIPGWEPGWKFDTLSQEILSPTGFRFHCIDLDNFALTQQLLRGWERIARDYEAQILEQKRHIEALEKRLSVPTKLRLYVNDQFKERRRLDVQAANSPDAFIVHGD